VRNYSKNTQHTSKILATSKNKWNQQKNRYTKLSPTGSAQVTHLALTVENTQGNLEKVTNHILRKNIYLKAELTGLIRKIQNT
jgi:hypothetical protein